MKVIFAIPTITGTVRTETMISLIETFQYLWTKGIEADIHILADCPYLPVARNSLAAMFRADPDATDHFWIDYDVAFPPEAVMALLERPEDVVAGAYRVKVDDHESYSVVPKVKDGIPIGKIIGEQKALIAADFLATGFLRVKRHVYDRMAEAYPELRYDENVVKTVNRPITEAYDFFATTISQTRKRFTTEDYSFCQRWRDIGGELWIYPDIKFDHIGKKAYGGNYHEFLMRQPGGAKSEQLPKSINIDKALHINGWMTPKELEWLALKAQERRNIVEVGCYLGRSTRALADNTPGRVVAIDDWFGPRDYELDNRESIYEAFLANMNGLIESAKVIALRQDHAKEPPKRLIEFADMVFIDGSHEYEHVARDIAMWKEKVPSGGLICGHDFHLPGVQKAVMELLPSFSIAPETSIWYCEVTR